MHEEFCAQIPILLDMMVEHQTYTNRSNKVVETI